MLKSKNHNNREQNDWEVQGRLDGIALVSQAYWRVLFFFFTSERRNRSAEKKKTFVIFKKPLAITYVSATLGGRFNTTACYQNIY